MRWSNFHTPTLRDAPADAEAASHKLLIRGGFMRQLHAGHYSMLPLGWRVFRKVEQIIREEMDAIGGQEFQLPTMHPASLWEKSGRLEVMGDEMFRLDDRKGRERTRYDRGGGVRPPRPEVTSYKALPQIWYQMLPSSVMSPDPRAACSECANSR